MRLDNILLKPIITEKTLLLAQDGKFTFEVAGQATKNSIALALKTLFNVDATNVNISVIKGKVRRFGAKRTPTKSTDSKKAIATLKKGQKIDYFEIVEEKDK
jgi:large subunit ribosomal protein L23